MKVSVSVLSSSDRIECIKKLNQTTTDYFHIDVMDGEFVNNYQMPIKEIEEIFKYTKKPLDIHLMVKEPKKYIEKLYEKKIKSKYLTFHLEVPGNKLDIINSIKEKGYKVGISIKPNTNIKEIIPYLSLIDLILVMSVEPGQGGQEFISESIDKIKTLKQLLLNSHNNILIEVDGGINNLNIKLLQDAGIDIVVIGSYIIKSDNYQNQIDKLKI